MLVTFEGIDDCGKSTQIQLLESLLKEKKVPFLSTRQPGGTEIGLLIRKILLNPSHQKLVPEVELLLYMADRIQHIQEIILPALQSGKMVLCDRYHDATLAYQESGRGLNLDCLDSFKQWIPSPGLTLWLDLEVNISMERIGKRLRDHQEELEESRLDRETFEFHTRVRAGYKKLWQENPERIKKIDASGSIQDVRGKINQVIFPEQ